LSRIKEFEGVCAPDQQISQAENELKHELINYGMKEGSDFNINSNGRWTDTDQESKLVYYLFEVTIVSKQAVDILKAEGLID